MDEGSRGRHGGRCCCIVSMLVCPRTRSTHSTRHGRLALKPGGRHVLASCRRRIHSRDRASRASHGALRPQAYILRPPNSELSTPPRQLHSPAAQETGFRRHCGEVSRSIMADYLAQLDAQLASLLSDWSAITTLLAVAIAAFVAYPIFYLEEPDTHPLLLARQSSAAPIRNRNESAAYRSPEVPYGTPLKAGLGVKDANAPRWAPGKNGDLRDVWREVLRGGRTGDDGNEVPKGAIMTVFGKEQVVEHDLQQLSTQIVVIGQRIKEAGAKKVAIYLPNSIEYLLTIFGAFPDLSALP